MTRPREDEQLPLSRTPPVSDDVHREIAFHLTERAAELERRGMPHDRALALAREAFGDSAAVEAECRAIERRRRATARRASRIAEFAQDVRLGARVLRKSRAFSVTAIITLAIGIGGTAAVFSILNQIVLQPLPYPNANRLVTFVERHANGGWANVAWATFLDVQEQSQSFDGVAEYGSGTTTVLTASGAQRVQAGYVSSGFFKVFPARPVMGRLPSPEEHRLGAHPVAVVSYAFWRDALGAPASLTGVHIKLALDHEVIGVLPPEFDFPAGNQVWRPMELMSQSMYRTSHNWPSVGRLRAGVTPTAAQREIDGILDHLRPVHYPDWDAVGSRVTLLQESFAGPMKTPLYLLFGAAAVLLLAACTNLASAMLARGTARSAEFALRSALGATRLRLVRQLLTESAVLALFGCLAGLGLAALLLRALAPLAPSALTMHGVRVNAWVQGFALAVAVATTALFGLFPALRLSDTNTGRALRESGGTSSGGRMRAWNVLVGTEVALAVTLLAGSALLIKSFANVMANELGFDTRGVIAVSVDLPPINYGDSSAKVSEFHERALAELRRIPGVVAAGFVNVLPLQGANPNGAMQIEGKPLSPRGPFTGYSIYRVIGRGYFRAIGTPVVNGRDFKDGDDRAAAPAVIVNQAFADREWPGQDPIGKRLKVAGMDSPVEPWFVVVGVAGNARASSVTESYAATYYFDYRQRPPYRSRSVSYVVRTTRSAGAMIPAIRKTLATVDPQVSVDPRPIQDVVAHAVADRRFTMTVLGIFAVAALVLASVGIYGVVSYAVAQRTREIGVRRALGATPRSVHRLIVSASMKAVVPGLVAGGLLALGGGVALRALLYGVSPFDASIVAIAIAALGAAALLASVIPAFRATRVDPMIAMRAD